MLQQDLYQSANEEGEGDPYQEQKGIGDPLYSNFQLSKICSNEINIENGSPLVGNGGVYLSPLLNEKYKFYKNQIDEIDEFSQESLNDQNAS